MRTSLSKNDARNTHSYPYISQIRNTGPHYPLWAPDVPAVVFHTLIHSNNLYLIIEMMAPLSIKALLITPLISTSVSFALPNILAQGLGL